MFLNAKFGLTLYWFPIKKKTLRIWNIGKIERLIFFSKLTILPSETPKPICNFVTLENLFQRNTLITFTY